MLSSCLVDIFFVVHFSFKHNARLKLENRKYAPADTKGEKQTPTFHVNLHENATIVGLLLLNPEKMKNVIILTSQSVKLLSYLYGNEFEERNISRISQICPKFAKFCSRNVTLV